MQSYLRVASWISVMTEIIAAPTANRNKIPEMFDVFDFPNPNLVSGVRNAFSAHPGATPLNNAFVTGRSGAAGRLRYRW